MESVYCISTRSSYSTVVESFDCVIIGYVGYIIMCSILGSIRYSNAVAIYCTIIRCV
jgi:hypothetical protein